MAAIDVNYVALRSLAGRTAVITGGCSGIGLATAELLLSIGCNVMLGDLHPPRHDPYQDKFLSSSQSLCYQECDITQWISLTALFDTALSKFGRIDIVCANAGVNDIGDPFFSTNLTETAGTLLEPNMKTLDINLKGTTNTIIAGMHHLKANGEGGSIIITASLAGYFGTTGMPLYTASKHALVGLMRALAAPALAHGVSISLVAPGMTETPLLAVLPNIQQSDDTEPDPTEETLQSLYAGLRDSGIPSQKPNTVALAIAYLVERGTQAAGKGLYVQGGEVIDLEDELARTRPEWLRQKMGYLLGSEGAIWKS